MRPTRGHGPLVAFALLAMAPASVRAQGYDGLVSSCSVASGGMVERCHAVAVALENARATFALAATGGADVPGSASTLGFRLRRFPRVALAGRMGAVRSTVPAVLDGYAPDPGEEGFFLPSLRFSATMGVLEGFSTSPNAGGILSVDLWASSSWVFPPREQGFHGGGLGWGLGGRLGLLRESFTLPGVSLSLAYRAVAEGRLGRLSGGGPAEARFQENVLSLRGVVGKDIGGIGFLGGAGWDQLVGEGSIGIRVSPTGIEASASAGKLTSERIVFFGGASMTFLILQVSAEGGVSVAKDPPLSGMPGGVSEPDLGFWFGSLGFRLTL